MEVAPSPEPEAVAEAARVVPTCSLCFDPYDEEELGYEHAKNKQEGDADNTKIIVTLHFKNMFGVKT